MTCDDGLGEHWAKADRKREPVAIHRDTAEGEREEITQVNHQLLMQIKVLRELQQQVIEVGARETQVDTFLEVNQHPTAPTDLRFKLSKMRSKVVSLHGDPKSLQVDISRKRVREYHVQLMRRTLPRQWEDQGCLSLHPQKLPID